MKGSLKDSITDTAMYLFEREGMLRYEAAQLSERIEKAWFEGRDTKTLKTLHFSVLREIESMRQAQEINGSGRR